MLFTPDDITAYRISGATTTSRDQHAMASSPAAIDADTQCFTGTAHNAIQPLAESMIRKYEAAAFLYHLYHVAPFLSRHRLARRILGI